MANRHDVIIWDADIYGSPDGFSEYIYEKAYKLIKQPANQVLHGQNSFNTFVMKSNR